MDLAATDTDRGTHVSKWYPKGELVADLRQPVLRRIRLGPRLALLYALPVIGLIAAVAFTSVREAQNYREHRTFASAIESLEEHAFAVDALQHERHLAVLEAQSPALDSADELALSQAAAATDASLRAINHRADLATTRRAIEAPASVRSRSGWRLDVEPYSDAIADATEQLTATLARAPSASITDQTAAFVSLLEAEEAARLETLAVTVATLPVEPHQVAEIAALHQRELIELSRAQSSGSTELASSLRGLTFSDAWSRTVALRPVILERGDAEARTEWLEANRVRVAGLQDLIASDHDRLVASAAEQRLTARGRLIRTIALAGFALAVLALAFVGLRRSITRPVQQLRSTVRDLAEGNLSVSGITGRDEVAELESSLVAFEDVLLLFDEQGTAVQQQLSNGNLAARLTPEDFSGYWRELASWLNGLLDGMETASTRAGQAERRQQITEEVQRFARTATSPEEVTHHASSLLRSLAPTARLQLAPRNSAPPAREHCLDIALESQSATALRLTSANDVVTDEDLIALATALGPVIDSVLQRFDAESSIEYHVEHDSLTGLPNLRGLTAKLESSSGTNAEPTWMISLTPCEMGAIESTYGIDARQAISLAIVARMKRVCGPDHLLARVSRDEYLVVGSTGSAAELSRRFLAAFDEPVSAKNVVSSVRLAAGWADRHDTLHGIDLAAAAGAACRESILSPTAAAIEFEPAMQQRAAERLRLRSWIEEALQDESFEVWYQPICHTATRDVLGYEALVRGRRDGELVSPVEFIDAAEEFGLIDELGLFVLRTALHDLAALRGRTPYISVNLSPLQLRNPSVVQLIGQALEQSGLEAARLTIELTEGAVIDSDPDVLARLDALSALGVGIAIDDFGTGYSSLSYLSRLPVGVVKLDRSLISPLGHAASAQRVVARTVELAHDLDMIVVAEGIENEQQLALLRESSADRVQGYLLGRPAALSAWRHASTAHPHP